MIIVNFCKMQKQFPQFVVSLKLQRTTIIIIIIITIMIIVIIIINIIMILMIVVNFCKMQ